MFRAIILPLFKNTRLFVTACGIMHPRCCRPVAGNIMGAIIPLPSTALYGKEDKRNKEITGTRKKT